MANAPFPIDPHLTGLSIAFRNDMSNLIADAVFPRVPVSKQEFKYLLHNTAEGYTIPDTKIGRKSSPNQVEFTATEVASFTEDYGLSDIIPINDVRNADGRYNPVEFATLSLTELVALDREVRAAGIAFDAARYAAANKTTLAGVTQWSDYTNSNPVTAIADAMDTMLIRPNRITMGRQVYTKVRQHPKVLEAVKSTGGSIAAGMVSREQLAALFEVEKINVGEAFVNTAKKGAAPTYARAWGKFCLLHYVPRVITLRTVAHGITAQWGDYFAGQQVVTQNAGLEGGIEVRSGERVRELLPAPDAGYLFSAAIA